MPTGYTTGVADGTITDFTEYALQCARAFGACITLRDESISSDIPHFEVNNYYKIKLSEARRDLATFLAMDESQQQKLYMEEYKNNIEVANKGIAEKQNQLQRYEKMLEMAKQFLPPSQDHINYANFLIDQLEESIKWDCDTSYYEKLKEPIEFEVWQSKKIKDLNWNIQYNEKSHKEEIERIESRNRWVSQLKESLGIDK